MQDKMLRDANLREDRLRKHADQLQRMLDRSEHEINSLQQVGRAVLPIHSYGFSRLDGIKKHARKIAI